MKQELINQEWKARTIRIRPDYVKLRNYLTFLSKGENIDFCYFWNEVIKFSLNHLIEKGFNYIIDKSDIARIPQYFPTDKDINKQFDTLFSLFQIHYKKQYGRKFFNYEFVELLLYIYAKHNLKPSELDNLKIDFGIRHIE